MNDEPSGEIVLYRRTAGTPAIAVRLDGETVWLNQRQLAELLDTSKQNISHHIRNILDEGELVREATVKEYLTVRQEGAREVRAGRRVLQSRHDHLAGLSSAFRRGDAVPHLGHRTAP
jgi:hypothetical protein